jgi:phospholipase C
MNQFMAAHLASNGDENGPVTMGYFARADLAFYYALADAFTVCDHYFCSVLGPAAPPEYGEYLVQEILTTLTSNPDVWAQTVFLALPGDHADPAAGTERPPA